MHIPQQQVVSRNVRPFETRGGMAVVIVALNLFIVVCCLQGRYMCAVTHDVLSNSEQREDSNTTRDHFTYCLYYMYTSTCLCTLYIQLVWDQHTLKHQWSLPTFWLVYCNVHQGVSWRRLDYTSQNVEDDYCHFLCWSNKELLIEWFPNRVNTLKIHCTCTQ